MKPDGEKTAPGNDGVDRGDTEAAAGWDAIAEWTGGISPDSVDALKSVREIEQAYPLLHALVGRSPRDFLVRAAAIEALVADGRGSFLSADLDRTIYWLDEPNRAAVLKSLRRSGWLSYGPDEGVTITDLGRWAYDVLSFLHRRLGEGEILPTLAGVEYALSIGMDPVRHLQSMRSRLVRLREEMELARRSHSEVILRDAARKLNSALDLSRQIRTVLDRIPAANRRVRNITRDIHDLLSQLHVVASDLQAAITEVGRQYLHLAAGLTVEQIVRALMRHGRDELGGVGRGALLPFLVPPPLLTVEVLASAAEEYVARDRVRAEPVRWEEPPDAPRGEESAEIPQEVKAFLSDLASVAAGGRDVALKEFVPRSDAATSFLRASLVSLAGESGSGEGITGRINALPVGVETEGDGWPEQLGQAPLGRLTPGRLAPRGRSA